MQHRLAALGSCAVVYAVSVAGCGQLDGDAGGGGGSSSGSGSASGLAGSGGEGEYSGECSARATGSTCGEDCPVTSDLLVFCDVPGFGRVGPRVAPRTDGPGVQVVTADEEQAWFVTARGEGSSDFLELPPGFEREELVLTTNPEGGITVAAETVNGVMLIDPLSSGSAELAVETEWYDVLTLEYDRVGSLGLAIRSETDLATGFERPQNGEFAAVATWVWDGRVWPVYTVEGAFIEVRSSQVEGERYLTANAGDGPYPLHSPLDDHGPLGVLRAAPALPADEAGVSDRYVVAAQADGVLMIVEDRQGDLRELEVSIPPYVRPTCLEEHDGHTPDTCPETCEEVTDGVFEGGVAIASTNDGRIWAAWVHTFIDETQAYRDYCWSDDGSGCTCQTEVTRDDTRAEIVLVEVDLAEGEVREALRLPSENADRFQTLTEHVLDLRAFGTELALGVRVRSAEHDIYRTPIRVIEVDTTKIASP